MINSHKAMLLQTLPFFGNSWTKDCALIVRFMKGIYFQRRPKPRYLFTWDVSSVLKYLSSIFPLENVSLKLLTFKVTALIALAAAPRAQTMVSMDLNYMVKDNNKLIFTFPELLKTTRDGHSFLLQLEHFENESLCAMHTLLFYIRKTRCCRLSSKVLVSYITYKAVSTSTVARWLKSTLELSGVNTEIFKAHSYRAASVSAAYSRGCSLKNILRTADWTSDKNFRKFYSRHSFTNTEVSFVNAVFDSHK